MIELYRAERMEVAINLMAKHIRNVLVDNTQWVRPRIKLRPNLLEGNVYFDKASSQHILWQNNGGVLLRHNRTNDYDNDVIFFTECPRSIEIMDRALRLTRFFAVIYEPPTWRPMFESIERRFSEKSEKQRYMAKAMLERMKQLLESSEKFTPRALAQILLVLQGQIPRPSFAPVLPSDAERSADIRRGVA